MSFGPFLDKIFKNQKNDKNQENEDTNKGENQVSLKRAYLRCNLFEELAGNVPYPTKMVFGENIDPVSDFS